MTSVTIEYCDPCGFLNRAIEAQKKILESYGDILDDVKLIPGDGGVFQVHVEDTVVFDIDDQEYDLTTIMEDVHEQLPTHDRDLSELVDIIDSN